MSEKTVDAARPLLVISDSHVSENHGNVQTFFEDLELISQTNWDLVFLGDIFELWVGHRRYETAIHQRFLAWCETQKAKRFIGFVEGNHEFYVVHKHGKHFTQCSPSHLEDVRRRLHFVHGDLVNKRDAAYLRFRFLTKNPFARALFWCLPFGPSLVDRIRLSLKSTNLAYKSRFPKEMVRSAWAHTSGRLVMGHFHQFFVERDGEDFVMVCPDYLSSKQAVLFCADGSDWVMAPIPDLCQKPKPEIEPDDPDFV